MANFTVNGLDRLKIGIDRLGAVPDSRILAELVLPAAEHLVTTMAEKAGSMMNVITGSLMNSVKITGKGTVGGVVFAQVGPDQKRHPGTGRGIRHRTAQGGGGGHYEGTNAEIAFIHEYGSSRTPGVHWMETAVNEDEDAIYGTMASGWDRLVDEIFGS